jgi:NTP pyrophosphatase (non-canonical NTP hydrolase)
MEKSPEALSRNAAATQAMLDVMARLRDPQRGCPWDIEKTF